MACTPSDSDCASQRRRTTSIVFGTGEEYSKVSFAWLERLTLVGVRSNNDLPSIIIARFDSERAAGLNERRGPTNRNVTSLPVPTKGLGRGEST